MKKILITLSVFLSVFPCFAQQTIELNNWKFHPGDNLEWTKPGFYDSQWETIHHERRVELAFEGHRYWDVRRWRTAVTDLSRSWSGIRYILDIQTGKYQLKVVDNIDGTSNVPQFRQENYYFPITISRTSNNTNLAENPGYN